MTDKPVYRWEVRRASKERREKNTGAISIHDLVIIAVIMAMLVIVLRFILIFGITQGMELGPFKTDVPAMSYQPSPYVNLPTVNDNFKHLTSISSCLFIYWALASWNSFVSPSHSLSTKLFKSTIGVSILVLFAASFFPEHATFLAENWIQPSYRPVIKG